MEEAEWHAEKELFEESESRGRKGIVRIGKRLKEAMILISC